MFKIYPSKLLGVHYCFRELIYCRMDRHGEIKNKNGKQRTEDCLLTPVFPLCINKAIKSSEEEMNTGRPESES